MKQLKSRRALPDGGHTVPCHFSSLEIQRSIPNLSKQKKCLSFEGLSTRHDGYTLFVPSPAMVDDACSLVAIEHAIAATNHNPTQRSQGNARRRLFLMPDGDDATIFYTVTMVDN